MHDDLDLSPQSLLTPKIVAGAITGGLLAVTVACVVTCTAAEGAAQQTPVVTLTLATFAVILVLIVRPIVTASLSSSFTTTSDTSPGQLLALYQRVLITDLAMIEGAGVSTAAAYRVEGQPWVLVIPALLLILLALKFPTTGRIQQWIRAKKEFSDF